METKFVPMDKLYRLKRGCVITEKIDGTNASVFIPEDLSFVQAGSRTRWITPVDDNFGFAAWVVEHAEELKQLGPGHHFGEWWGQGIQRRYGLSERRFSLFNSGRWSSERPACCHVVPVVKACEFTSDAVDSAMASLKETGSLAAPGFMDPEGVVVWLASSRTSFKVTYDDKHKGGEG